MLAQPSAPLAHNGSDHRLSEETPNPQSTEIPVSDTGSTDTGEPIDTSTGDDTSEPIDTGTPDTGDTGDTCDTCEPVDPNDALMTAVQEGTFRYFWDFAHPDSGTIREGYTHWSDISTAGGTGMGYMAIVVGSERGL